MLPDAEEQWRVGSCTYTFFGVLQVVCHGREMGKGEQTLLLGNDLAFLVCALVGGCFNPFIGVKS